MLIGLLLIIFSTFFIGHSKGVLLLLSGSIILILNFALLMYHIKNNL